MTTQRIAAVAGFWAGLLASAFPLGQALADVPQKLNDEGRLYDTTANAPVTGSHTLKFVLYSASGTQLWSQTSTVMINDGFFAVTLDGSASANLFPANLFDGSELQLGLTVDSDAEMSPRQPLDSVPYAIAAGGLASRPKCPPGYAQDASITTFVDCKATLSASQVDDMVRVGDYWIDRYEISSCGGLLGDVTGNSTSATGCSVSGVTPQSSLSWFQASEMCANAGKHLCTNQEWQTAAAGSPHPGANADGTGGTCDSNSTNPRVTGGGSQCVSNFGAQDMAGNLWEWTAEWGQFGPDFPGMTPGLSSGGGVFPVPPFDNSATYNVNGTAAGSGVPSGSFLPASMLRGGAYNQKDYASIFDIDASNAPDYTNSVIGARCCVGGAY
jgi:hypothetical protein